MKRKSTNSWIAAGLTWAFFFGAWLWLGWAGVLLFFLAFLWGATGLIWNMLRADALRPRAEWSDKPTPWKDWVL